MGFTVHTRSLYFYIGLVSLVILTLVFSTPRQAVAHLGQRVADGLTSFSFAKTCPNPYLATTNRPTSLTLPADVLRSTGCEPVPTVSDDFAVTACRNEQSCNALDLIIRRMDGSTCTALEEWIRTSPVSNDTSLNDFVRSGLGPDGFMIVVDGGERQTHFLPDAYLGDCAYRFSLRLNNAGSFAVQVWHHYEHYNHYWENNMTWPPQATERVLLKAPLFFEACDGCHSFVASPPASLAIKLSQPVSSGTKHLPSCSDAEPVYGSFVPVSYLEARSGGDFYLPQPANQNAYRFVAAGGCHYEHAGGRFDEHDACFALPDTRVLMHGDSHQRVLYDGIVHRLEGHQTTMEESEKSGHKNSSFDNRYLDFHWDPSGHGMFTLDCDLLKDFDVVSFSIGHHLHEMSTAEYTAHMTEIFETVTATSNGCSTTSGQSRRLVYVTPPAVAPREDEFVRELNDRRTNARMTHWTAIGLDLARKNGWRSVDQYHFTRGFVRDVKDMVHFLETDALDPTIDDLIAKLGICDRS